VASSALAVGVNRSPQAVDETADWDTCHFDLAYAITRRQAEIEALAQSRAGFRVVAVNPSFTMGPEDYAGAPANKLIKAVAAGKLPVTFKVGFGCLDVRDFARGMVLAAEHGRPGTRYLLSGCNVMLDELLKQVAEIAGVKPPRWRFPISMAYVLVAVFRAVKTLTGEPPGISFSVLQILGRYAWYDVTRAREELCWVPRPLQQTLEDTLREEPGVPEGSRKKLARPG
jgi:dihydroflavonol-4-reductase